MKLCQPRRMHHIFGKQNRNYYNVILYYYPHKIIPQGMMLLVSPTTLQMCIIFGDQFLAVIHPHYLTAANRILRAHHLFKLI